MRQWIVNDWQGIVTIGMILLGGIIHLDRRITRLEGTTKLRRAIENDLRQRMEALEEKTSLEQRIRVLEEKNR